MRSALVHLSNSLGRAPEEWDGTGPRPSLRFSALTPAELEKFALRRPRTASSPAPRPPTHAWV
jgi:hypothetical protein